jgi:drug/metabolite transporter (DMT)-like permease
VYGAADFFGGLASRRTTTPAVVVWSQAAGALVLALAWFAVPGVFNAADVAWGALGGILGSVAIVLLYRGLAIGSMGVVSPLTAILAALLPVLYGALRRVPIALPAAIGIGLSLLAVAAISSAPPESREKVRLGIPEAISAGVLFGVFFIVLAQTHAAAGLYPLVGARAASMALFLLGSRIVGFPLRPARAATGIIIAAGACDMLANILYVLAVHRGAIAIVAVLTSLYPASTVALAAIFLHERLRPLQWAGVGLALAGVALISAGR